MKPVNYSILLLIFFFSACTHEKPWKFSTGQLSKNDYIYALKGLLTPLTATGDYLLSYLDDYSLYKDLVDNGFERADETVEKHLTNEGAVILKYKLK